MKKIKHIMRDITRRDFLRSGTSGTFGYLCLPSLATLLHNSRALAEVNCQKAAVNNDIPAFIAIDLRGGASIAGNNVMVYDKDGGFLSSYSGLGLTAYIKPSNSESCQVNVDTSLGLAFHANSPMLRGIKSALGTGQAATAISEKVNGVVFCTRSADDTSSNELATAPGVFLGGAKGSILPLVGTEGALPGESGGYSKTPFVSDVAPTRITDIESAKRIISAGDNWTNSPQVMQKVLTAIEKMSVSQLQKFTQLSLPEQAKEMLHCGYIDAQNLLLANGKGSTVIGARDSNSGVEAILGQGGVTSNEAAIEIAYLILKGFAGSGTIVLGEYDYHDNTVTTGESKDNEAGEVIGTIIRMADALKRKVMIHVYTDGGVYSSGTAGNAQDCDVGEVQKFAWIGDSEVRSAAFVLVYDPTGKPSLTDSLVADTNMMGAYKSADRGTIDLSPPNHAKIAGSPRAQAAVVVANWLAWQGREREIFEIMRSDNPLTINELEEYLFMKKS